MDLLSDFRDDHPDELVQWTQLKDTRPSMTREEATNDWGRRHNETLDITEAEGSPGSASTPCGWQ